MRGEELGHLPFWLKEDPSRGRIAQDEASKERIPCATCVLSADANGACHRMPAGNNAEPSHPEWLQSPRTNPPPARLALPASRNAGLPYVVVTKKFSR